MKKLSLLLLVVALLSPPAHAGKESGGGDAYTQEFTAIGRIIAKFLLSEKLVLSEVDAKTFNNVVETMTLESKDRLFLKGVEVDAINHPAKLHLEMSRARWKDYATEPQKKFGLVFHEVLALMEVADKKYKVSDKILAQIHVLSTQALETIIRDKISEECGDTWCTSDLTFDFHQFSCAEEKGCHLTMVMIDKSVPDTKERSDLFKGKGVTTAVTTEASGTYIDYDAACTFANFTKPEAVVEIEPSSEGGRVELKREFMHAMETCMEPLIEKFQVITQKPKQKVRKSILKPQPK